MKMRKTRADCKTTEEYLYIQPNELFLQGLLMN